MIKLPIQQEVTSTALLTFESFFQSICHSPLRLMTVYRLLNQQKLWYCLIYAHFCSVNLINWSPHVPEGSSAPPLTWISGHVFVYGHLPVSLWAQVADEVTRPEQRPSISTESCQEDGGRLDVTLQSDKTNWNVNSGDVVGIALQGKRKLFYKRWHEEKKHVYRLNEHSRTNGRGFGKRAVKNWVFIIVLVVLVSRTAGWASLSQTKVKPRPFCVPLLH